MPNLNIQISPLGPVMDVFVSVSQPRADALKNAGQVIPVPIAIRALVDTGESCSCVDPTILTALGLSPTGSASIHTPTTAGTAANHSLYDVGLVLPHPKGSLSFPVIPVVSTHLQMQGIQGLIGRDILKTCLLIYN